MARSDRVARLDRVHAESLPGRRAGGLRGSLAAPDRGGGTGGALAGRGLHGAGARLACVCAHPGCSIRQERSVSGLTVVTGATGFIGGHLVRQLVADGVHTRVLVRRPESLSAALRARVEVVRGDVRDAGTLVAAVRGAETVLHLAACARAWARDPAEFTAVNVHTVERLLESAHAAGVSRLVHVSTMLTLPPGRPAPLDGLAARPTPYEESKRAGERLVESYAAAGRHAGIVHPTRVYGSGPCNDANAVTRVIALYLRGRFRVRLDDGDVLASYVHAADVADGIRRAARAGRSGAHYVLGGENLSFRAFLDLVGEVSGVRRKVVALPRAAAGGGSSRRRGWSALPAAPLAPPLHFVAAAVLLAVVPVLAARRLTGLSLTDLGLGLGRWRAGVVWVAIGVPLAVLAGRIAALSPAIRAVYPLDPALTAAPSAFGGYAALELPYFG